MPDSNRSLITALTRQLQQAKAELRATEAVIRAYHLGVCDAVAGATEGGGAGRDDAEAGIGRAIRVEKDCGGEMMSDKAKELEGTPIEIGAAMRFEGSAKWTLTGVDAERRLLEIASPTGEVRTVRPSQVECWRGKDTYFPGFDHHGVLRYYALPF